jgi:hypothetical protein
MFEAALSLLESSGLFQDPLYCKAFHVERLCHYVIFAARMLVVARGKFAVHNAADLGAGSFVEESREQLLVRVVQKHVEQVAAGLELDVVLSRNSEALVDISVLDVEGNADAVVAGDCVHCRVTRGMQEEIMFLSSSEYLKLFPALGLSL